MNLHRALVIVLAAGLLAWAAAPARAGEPPLETFVDCGYEGPSNGTEAMPWTSIAVGLDSVASGGTVNVTSGFCPEEVVIQNDVFLEGEGPNFTFILGDVMVEDGAAAWVHGFTIMDDEHAGVGCVNAWVTLTNTVIRDQPADGINASGCTVVAINNTIVDNDHNGILLLNSSDAIVQNNIFARNGQIGGVFRDESSMADPDYNDFWMNGDDDYELDEPGTFDLHVDPLFRSPADLRLRTGSPLIDAGDPAPSLNDGNGTRNDVGAFGGPYGAEIYFPGDVGCDTRVNAIDAALVLQYTGALLGDLTCPQNADLNADATINAIDAALILQFDAGLLESLPA